MWGPLFEQDRCGACLLGRFTGSLEYCNWNNVADYFKLTKVSLYLIVNIRKASQDGRRFKVGAELLRLQPQCRFSIRRLARKDFEHNLPCLTRYSTIWHTLKWNDLQISANLAVFLSLSSAGSTATSAINVVGMAINALHILVSIILGWIKEFSCNQIYHLI